MKHPCSGYSRHNKRPCVFHGCKHEGGKWWCEIHAPSNAEKWRKQHEANWYGRKVKK